MELRRHILHRQAGDLVFRVFHYFKGEAENGRLVQGGGKSQESAFDACDIDLMTVKFERKIW
jgi:hypothetical protein